MSPMRLIILLVAAVAAAGAAFLVRNMAQPAPAPTPVPVVQAPVQVTEIIEVPQTPVLILTRDVRVGDLLYPTDFAWRDWPDETVNVNYFTQDMYPTAIDELSGSVVRTAMVTNEPLLPHKIVQKGATGYMAALLAPGMRAVSVEISADNASGGFILPGDRVDVMITYDVRMETATGPVSRPTTTAIIENARILAIDQIFGEGSGGQFVIGSTATIELFPDQARLLTLSDRLGAVSLVLRSLHDAEEGGPTLARTDFLLDVEPFANGATGINNTVSIWRQGAVTVETPGGEMN